MEIMAGYDILYTLIYTMVIYIYIYTQTLQVLQVSDRRGGAGLWVQSIVIYIYIYFKNQMKTEFLRDHRVPIERPRGMAG